MYYDDIFVDSLVKELKIPGGESYVQHTAEALAPILVQKPEVYKTFGVYWWAMKDALKKYGGIPDAWFMGKSDDIVMKTRAWHGDEFRTILAAAYYHSGQLLYTSDHQWTDKYGVEHDYSLFDPDAGF
jgi:hypothetical protein